MSEQLTTRILVTRHGETAWNRESIFRGRYDVPLNDTGRAQAARLRLGLSDTPIDAAFSSPISRALETAQIALEGRDIPIQSVEALTDFDFGAWTGLQDRVVAERWPREYAVWRSTPERAQIPGGETLQAVYERANAWLAELVAANSDKTVALFSHRVVIKMIALGCLTLGPERFGALRQDNCCLNEFEHGPKGYIVVRLNDTSHLRACGMPPLATDF